MLLLRDDSLRAWRSPVDILSLSFLLACQIQYLPALILPPLGRSPELQIAGLVVPSPTSRGKDEVRFLPREKYIVVAFVSQID